MACPFGISSRKTGTIGHVIPDGIDEWRSLHMVTREWRRNETASGSAADVMACPAPPSPAMAMAEQQDRFSLAAALTLQQAADDDRDPGHELVVHKGAPSILAPRRTTGVTKSSGIPRGLLH